MTIRFGLAAGLAALALTVSAPALGQGGLFEQGRSLLDRLGAGGGQSALGEVEIGKGLKEALRVGTGRVVDTLGRAGGFYDSSDVHIPLPGALASVQKALSRFGMGGLADELELRLNRAAEAAVPRGKALFWDAVEQMTLDDARAILDGPKDSATRYFQGKMAKPLAAEMTPIVDQELAAAGAVKAYDDMMGQYRALPFVPDVKANLTQYVVEKALDGVFLYLAREEAAIRENPAARTTALLKRVFGG